MGKGKKTSGMREKGVNPVIQGIQEKRKLTIEEKAKKDEKVVEIINDYNKMKEELERQYSLKEKALEDTYAAKKEELTQERNIFETEKKAFETEEKKKIFADLEKEKESILMLAEKDAEIAAKKLVDEMTEEGTKKLQAIENRKKEIDAQNQLALKEFQECEKEILEKKAAAKEEICKETELQYAKADLNIEEKYKKIREEREALTQEKIDLADQRANFDREIQELEADKEYLKELKNRFLECSPKETEELRNKLKYSEQLAEVMKKRLEELSKQLSKYEAYADNEQLIVINQRQDKEIEELKERLDNYSNYPSLERIEELKSFESEIRNKDVRIEKLIREKEDIKNELDKKVITTIELESAQKYAAALSAINNNLQKKIDDITSQHAKNYETKFKGLLKIDEESKMKQKEISTRKEFQGSLADLVKYVRNYGAANREKKLYYTPEMIRAFIASLATTEPNSRLIILQGLSGTGKSSMSELFDDALCFNRELISVQPSWRDKNELLGYDNDFTNRFKETEFTKALYKASLPENREIITLIVLDEMNLARIEYYFADFLSTLESDPSKWIIPLVSNYDYSELNANPKGLNYSNGSASLVVTENIWFIGTANNDDSTSLITDKVYDRAQIIDMDKSFENFTVEKVTPCYIKMSKLKEMFDAAKRDVKNRLNKDDKENIAIIDEILTKMKVNYGNRMKLQLEDFVPVYVACGGTKEAAIDYFLAHKVLRKLETKYEMHILDDLKELYDTLCLLYQNEKISIDKILEIKKNNFNKEKDEW